ncbi:trypsin, alkaline C-like [Aricia agestis]|uniref:trypsin, alkaline C-like n=1 Tax=Aricia agestis TaxID=91739 RepID=UPI001C203B58|nr:trypsin, alkaline C-like [Aricia agestis]
MWPGLIVVFIGAVCAENALVAELSSDPNSRIIGGAPTTIEKYPFIVQVLYQGQLACGGSLLSAHHVLTAAHCFVAADGTVVSPALFSVRVGSARLGIDGTVHAVSALVLHERYNSPARDNDVAVMTLATAAMLSSRVQLAYIPVQGAVVPENATLTQLGWGKTSTSSDATASEVLNAVDIRKVNRSVCAARYEYLASVVQEPFPVTENMICAGLLDVGGKDACQGDSGGPLLYAGVVVGVTSWGWGCAQPTFPGVSARVSQYTTWINDTVAGVAQSRVPSAGYRHLGHIFIIGAIISLWC